MGIGIFGLTGLLFGQEIPEELLEDDHVRIYRHTNRQYDTCHTWKRQYSTETVEDTKDEEHVHQ